MKFPTNPHPCSRLAGAVLLATAAALPAFADYQSTVLSQGPVGYYRLNETTQPLSYTVMATNAGSLGATANGSYNNFPTRALTGPFAGSLALGLDGTSQSVTTPYQASLNPSAFTAEIWVNPANVPAFGYIATSVHTASPRSGWYLVQDNNGTFGLGNGFVVRMFYQNAANPSITLFATNDLPLGSWYHLVLTYDGTTATLYKNGAVAQSGAAAFVPNVDAQFSIGMRSDNNFWWGGQAAEAALYNGALSSTRVTAHYVAATTTPALYATTVQADSPLLYYRFQEPADPVAANIGSLGASANGRYVYPARPGVNGAAPPVYSGFDAGNKSVAFGGSGGAVALKPLNLNTNTVTITCWLNLTNPQATAAGIVFCRAGTTVAGLTTDPVGYGGGYGLGYNWGGQGAGWSPTQDAGLPTLPDSDWAFAALVVSPAQAAIFTCDRTNYLNFAGATNIPTAGHSPQAFAGTTDIGLDPGTTTPIVLNGAVDEVAVFNRALSSGEVYTEYATAVGNVPPRVFSDPQPPTGTVYAGDTLELTVDAGGTPNLSYQWRKDSSPISGATTSAFVKNPVATTDGGTYDCVITNTYGTATSGSVFISINPATLPTIVTGPVGHTLYPGGSINLSVVATGGGLGYQWNKGGSPIAGATGSSYSVFRAAVSDGGSYSVLVTNSLGNATGGPVTINVLTPATQYEQAIVNDSPEAWYRLNETSGTTMFDSMGRHDGYYSNYSGTPVTLGAPGALAGSSDTAVTFAGGANASFGFVPYSARLNGRSFTIECWAKTTDTTGTGAPVSSRSGVPQGYWLWDYPSGQWSGGVSAGGNNYYVPSGVAGDGVVAGQWKHVVMLFDASTALRVYIDGQWDGNAYVDFDRNAGGPLIIGGLGGSTSASGVDTFWSGQVDEVLVYTNALTLAQAQNHYNLGHFGTPTAPFFLLLPGSQEVLSNSAATITLTGSADGSVPITYQWLKNGTAIAGATTTILTLNCDYTNAASYMLHASNGTGATNSPPAIVNIIPPSPAFVNVTNGLVLHLKFDGNYQDSSGRGNNATAVGSPSIVAGRLGSGALYFYTSNSIPSVNYLTLGKPADLNFGSSVDFSVAYWVKTEPGQTNGDLPFLCSAITSTFAPGFTFAPSYKQGGWAWSLNGLGVYGAPASINDGNWHHVLSSFTRAGYGYTYLDGVQVDSRLVTSAGNLDTGNTVNIGQDPTGAYTEDGSATIDDLAVWRRALTPYEAYAIYYSATNSNLSFDVPGRVKLNLSKVGSNLQITWHPGATLGTLLQADSITGPWTPVPVYVPSYTVTPSGAQKFYRLQTIE